MGGIIIILLALCISTCVIEIIPLLFLKNKGKWIKTSILCNVVTNPILNMVLAFLTLVIASNLIFIIITVILEIAVVGFETFIYYNAIDEKLRKCIVISLLTNICSFAMGLIIF